MRRGRTSLHAAARRRRGARRSQLAVSRPALAAGTAVAFAVAAAFASHDGGGEPRVSLRAPVIERVDGIPEAPLPAHRPISPGVRRLSLKGQDMFDERSDTSDARWRRDNPAYQALPWQGGGVLIEVAGAAGAGRVALRIAYVGTPPAARRAYRRFLALHGDAGRGYVPRFVSWSEYRRLLCPPSSDADCPLAPTP